MSVKLTWDFPFSQDPTSSRKLPSPPRRFHPWPLGGLGGLPLSRDHDLPLSIHSLTRPPTTYLVQTDPNTPKKINTNNLRKLRLPIVRPAAGERVIPIRTQARSATILPNFVGLKFLVHNGKIYNEVTITEDMVGHKLGEFSTCVPLLPSLLCPPSFSLSPLPLPLFALQAPPLPPMLRLRVLGGEENRSRIARLDLKIIADIARLSFVRSFV